MMMIAWQWQKHTHNDACTRIFEFRCGGGGGNGNLLENFRHSPIRGLSGYIFGSAARRCFDKEERRSAHLLFYGQLVEIIRRVNKVDNKVNWRWERVRVG